MLARWQHGIVRMRLRMRLHGAEKRAHHRAVQT